MPKGKRKEPNKAWGKNEDLKLHRLFRIRNDRGGVDSRDLTQKISESSPRKALS